MLQRLRPRLTYANVIATLALFLALGGGAAFAAATLGKNTVGARQLKRNAVTGVKVKDGSLTGTDFRAGQLPRGARGPAGERGPVGERGPQGAPGATNVVVRYGTEGKPKQNEVGDSVAACLSGEALTGGGFDLLNEPEEHAFEVEASGPIAGEGEVEGETVYLPPSDGSPAIAWHVKIANGEPSDTVFFRAYAICARP